MAEEYTFPVLVELEESKTPRLKNKLVKYFQSKKSNGGDCEVDYESGSSTALLRFLREEDQKNVLGKESHQISLDEGVLKMAVRLPSDGKQKQVRAKKWKLIFPLILICMLLEEYPQLKPQHTSLT
uniref:PAR14-like first RRM domain-containing protein n=1 Tax=Xiphophorus maculatus TaxID=8083 RepID=A0A3B5Q1P3_XIPMA